MRIVLALLLAVALRESALDGAVVQGVVLDQETGAPLARTLLELIPVEGTRAKPVLLRAAERGNFAIISVAPGWYILRGSRKAYVTAEAGQSRAGRAGRPFQVERDDQSFFLELRLSHSGALSGVLVDENNVGIPEWDVHVFTARRPIARVAQGKTDDRGNFRIWGLEAGKYFVRSGEGELEDGATLLPTFHRFGTALLHAEPVVVRYNETTPDVRVQPQKGRLFSLRGQSFGCTRVTLITDTSRRSLDAASFSVERLPPGQVDLIGEGLGYAGVVHLDVDRDFSNIRLPCTYQSGLQIQDASSSGQSSPGQSSRGQSSRGQSKVKLQMRRLDLDGPGEWRVYSQGERLVPGAYEILASLEGQNQYAYSMQGDSKPGKGQPDGSFLVDLSPSPRLSVSFRPAAQITGTVVSDSKPVIGAPVLIEMFDPGLPQDDKRLWLWAVRTDVSGHYAVSNLPPAQYRILSSFDFDSEDRYAMDKGSALTLKGGDSVVQDLKMLP